MGQITTGNLTLRSSAESPEGDPSTLQTRNRKSNRKFARDMEIGLLAHFQSLKQFKQETNYELDTENLKNVILEMQEAFTGPFQEFRKENVTL